MRIKISQLTANYIGKNVTIKGWIKTVRQSKNCIFILCNDGSTLAGIQVVVDPKLPDYVAIHEKLSTGASIAVNGLLVQSPGKEQAFEVQAEAIELLGECPSQEYTLQKKHHTL